MTEGIGVCDVLGAAVGFEVTGGFVGAGDAFPVWVADGFGEDVAPWLAVGRGEAVAVPVCECVDVPDGVNIDGTVEEELVHAQSVTETRTIKVAQLTAVSPALATLARVIMRAFTKLLYARQETIYTRTALARNRMFSI